MQKLAINPRAKGLIFDLDGTLADTMPVHFEAYQNVLSKYGVDYSAKMFLALAGVPAVETIERINEVYGVELNPKEVGYEKEAEYERMMHKIKPIDPVIDLVKKYHGKLPMAVGTGGYRKLALKTLEFIGLTEYIDIVVTADDVKNFKPHPETFLSCAKHMGIAPQDCEVFEDGEPGMKAARAAGMMATLITEYYDVFKA